MIRRTIFSFVFSLIALVSFSEGNENLLAKKIESEIVALVNQHRKSKGLNALIPSEAINLQAKSHSSNMATRRANFGNDGFNKRTAAIKDEIGGQRFSENVAYGHSSAQTAFNSWLNNATHKKNIEGDFTHIGVGVAQSRNGTLYFTQIFVKVDPDAILALSDEISRRLEADIVALVNKHRATLGLKPLSISNAITNPSRVHSENMASGKERFSHNGFDERVNQIKEVIGGISFAENLAFGQPTAASVVDSWLRSPGHRKNIEGDFTHIGIGIAQREDKVLFYTQIFVKLRN